MKSFSSPQPNVPGRGIIAGYSARFWGMVIAIGLASGLAGAAFTELLKATERLAWARPASAFLTGIMSASAARHVLVLSAAGVLAGAGALVLPRLRGSGGGEISEALWLGDGRLDLLPSLARGVLSIITVGMGVSLGREAAPQLAGAAFASELSARAPTITPSQRRLLVACGGGAGMAAVYNVPLGGALFALEVLLGSLALTLVVPALLASLTATAAAWIVIPDRATYIVPIYGVSARQILWAALIGPIAGLVAVSWVKLIGRANTLRPRHDGRFLAPIVIFTALGLISIPYPQLLGNGADVVQLALIGNLSLGLLAALVVLKPLVTAACLATGSPGGLFTPTLATGVLFGALLGHAWGWLWPGSPVGSYALIGGGAFLAASMQGPLSATVLILELTRSTGTLTVPLLLAVSTATIVARRFGAPSIYSARLPLADQEAAARSREHDRCSRDAPAE